MSHNYLLLLAVSAQLVACAHGATPDRNTEACESGIPLCPAGAGDEICHRGDGYTQCCLDGIVVMACSRPAGILTRDCQAQCSAQCAVSGSVSTCCSEGERDPCETEVDGGPVNQILDGGNPG